MVFQRAVGKGIVGHHVKVAGAGQAKEDGLLLAGLLALKCLVDGNLDGMGALGCGQDGLELGKLHAGLKDLGLLDGDGACVAVVHEFGDDGAHAVVAQAACVVGGGQETVAQRVHLAQRAGLASVCKVVGVAAARHRGAAGGLDADEVRVRVGAVELVLHKGAHQAAHVGAAACAADDHVRVLAQLLKRRLGLQADDRLMQDDLVENAAQLVAAAVVGYMQGLFHSLRDRGTKRAGGVGVVGQHLAPDLCRVRRGRRHVGAKGLHDVAAEGLLLVGAFDHEDLAVKAVVRGCLRKSGSPLASAGLSRDGAQALLCAVVGLCQRGVELVRAGGVVALELVEDLGGRAQSLLQVVGAAQRAWAVDLVHLADALGDLKVARVVVELLADELVAKDGADVVELCDLAVGKAHGLGFLRHVCADVVVLGGNLVLAQVEAVGFGCIVGVVVAHGLVLSGLPAHLALAGLSLAQGALGHSAPCWRWLACLP